MAKQTPKERKEASNGWVNYVDSLELNPDQEAFLRKAVKGGVKPNTIIPPPPPPK